MSPHARGWLVPFMLATAACGDSGVGSEAHDVGEDRADDSNTVPETAEVAVPDVSTPDATACAPARSAGFHTYTCPGTTHPTYLVSLPERCVSDACGLILDIHGGGGSAEQEEALTDLRALGEQYGFVVIQPNAAGPNGPGFWDPAGADDDTLFAFVTSAIDALGIDPNRVHMIGFSNGGFMTWRSICKHADLLASAAPAAAAFGSQYNLEPATGKLIGCSFTEGDMPSEPIDILFMAGRKDECFRFASESDGPDSAEEQRDAVVRLWGLFNEEQVAGDEHFTRTRYSNDQGTVLEVIWHDYEKGYQICPSQWRPPGISGHCTPTSTGAQGACIGPTAFSWGEEAVRFFVAHPRH